jgi:predicted O-methyltransferase YrrM
MPHILIDLLFKLEISYSELFNNNILILLLCSYDFAFVDADKRLYNEYFELLFQLVSPM